MISWLNTKNQSWQHCNSLMKDLTTTLRLFTKNVNRLSVVVVAPLLRNSHPHPGKSFHVAQLLYDDESFRSLRHHQKECGEIADGRRRTKTKGRNFIENFVGKIRPLLNSSTKTIIGHSYTYVYVGYSITYMTRYMFFKGGQRRRPKQIKRMTYCHKE